MTGHPAVTITAIALVVGVDTAVALVAIRLRRMRRARVLIADQDQSFAQVTPCCDRRDCAHPYEAMTGQILAELHDHETAPGDATAEDRTTNDATNRNEAP